MTNQTPPSQPTRQPARKLTAEVVSIGDEMTSGARLDTNAQWLSRRVEELGVEVTFHSTVGDTLSHNVDVLRIAANRADVVVCTGGLGPTRDDLTREALAAAVDQPLELSKTALRHIKAIFTHRNREMPERNQLQAMFPAGSIEIFNPQGTAPGVEVTFEHDDTHPSHIFALPGVPAEMKRMFDDTVAPRIMELSGGVKTITHQVMKFFGAGESEMERRLGDMITRDRQPRVGITVTAATISLRISAIADDLDACNEMIVTTRDEIMQRVGDLYFGEGESYEQHQAIDEALQLRSESLAIAELGFAAPLGDWFAALGEIQSYRGGVSVAAMSDLQQLTDETDESATLRALKERFRADWLVLVDQYPSLQTAKETALPAVDVRFVIVDPDNHKTVEHKSMGGHPAILQQRIGKEAMRIMRGLLAK